MLAPPHARAKARKIREHQCSRDTQPSRASESPAHTPHLDEAGHPVATAPPPSRGRASPSLATHQIRTTSTGPVRAKQARCFRTLCACALLPIPPSPRSAERGRITSPTVSFSPISGGREARHQWHNDPRAQAVHAIRSVTPTTEPSPPQSGWPGRFMYGRKRAREGQRCTGRCLKDEAWDKGLSDVAGCSAVAHSPPRCAVCGVHGRPNQLLRPTAQYSATNGARDGSSSQQRNHTSRRKKSKDTSPEHPNLIHDVVPRARRLQLLAQDPVQLVAHLDDATRHRLDVALPLLEQRGVVQDERDLRFMTNAIQFGRARGRVRLGWYG